MALIGTAGWSVDRSLPDFSQQGTSLEHYASLFTAVEINTSFYRRHRAATWQRWHDAVPDKFKFSVKLPKIITHERLLLDSEDELKTFLDDVAPLGAKLRAILVQLPPKLVFDADAAGRFLATMRSLTTIPVFVEPRHNSWANASELLAEFDIGRVHADPQSAELRPMPQLGALSYFRLHGSPKIYYSAYLDAQIESYAELLRGSAPSSWCIFDNTASGAAIKDAVRLLEKLGTS